MSQPIYHTPRTTLHWSTLSEWLRAACQLESRRATSLNTERKRLHIDVLPLHLIAECDDASVLMNCRAYLTGEQPTRGRRASAPHTPLIVAINNRLARLETAE